MLYSYLTIRTEAQICTCDCAKRMRRKRTGTRRRFDKHSTNIPKHCFCSRANRECLHPIESAAKIGGEVGVHWCPSVPHPAWDRVGSLRREAFERPRSSSRPSMHTPKSYSVHAARANPFCLAVIVMGCLDPDRQKFARRHNWTFRASNLHRSTSVPDVMEASSSSHSARRKTH